MIFVSNATRKLKLVLLVVTVLLLAGCIGPFKPSIVISVDPNPVILKFQDTEVEISVTFKTKGLGGLQLDSLTAKLLNDAKEEVCTKTQDIDKFLPVVPFVGHEESITITLPEDLQYADEESYNDNLKDKTYKLTLLLQGSMDDVLEEVDFQFK